MINIAMASRKPLSLLITLRNGKLTVSLFSRSQKEDMFKQLKELLTSDTLSTLFRNLQKYMYVFQFQQHRQSKVSVKLIKNRLRNRLNELGLSNLMKMRSSHSRSAQ